MKAVLKAVCKRCGSCYVRAVEIPDDGELHPLPTLTGISCTNTVPLPPTWDRCSWLYSELAVESVQVLP